MNDADGKIVIGTEIDTKQLETDLKKLGQKFEKLETQADKLQKRKIEIEVKLKDTYKKEMDAITKDYDDVVNKEFEFASKNEPTYGRKAPQKFMDWIDPIYQKRIDEVNKRYASQITSLNNINEKLKENANEQERIKANIDEVNNVLANRKGIDAFLAGSKEINNSLSKIIKKVGKWALAVFGVRSAYMFIRNAINTIAGQDEQLKADIDGIKVALAYTIEPLVRGIVNLMKTLMGYVAYIVKAWTGRDIFAKSAKSLANANKSAKDLNKSLFGFDKINKLSGNKDNNSSGVSSSIKPLEEGEEPGWLKWIGDNGDRVKTILMSIATALVAIKLGAGLLTATAVGAAVYGIVMSLIDLIDLLKDPTWKKFGQFLIDIGIAIMAISIIVGGLPAIIGGAIVLVVGLIIKYWDQCKDYIIAGVMFFVDTFIGALKGIGDFFKDIFYGIYNIFKDVIYAIISLFKGDFKSSITYLGKAIGNVFITIINTIINAINTVISPIRSLIVAVGKVTGKNWTMNNIKIPTIPRLAQGGIVHNPGSGVMMGNYIAGEGRNPEAVIPLDDATLDRLGQAIARHSQINATIVNEMDGRVLSKNLARVHSENAFARNGGY